MIISHKNKFIFIKPTKVASTSVEINLAQQCGPQDIVTPISDYRQDSDDDKYDHKPINYDGFENHTTPKEVQKKIDSSVWNDYFKVTIVRNPWDNIVSKYWQLVKQKSFRDQFEIIRKSLNWRQLLSLRFKWLLSNLKSKNKSTWDFYLLVNNFPVEFTNTRYYFSDQGEPLMDYYIRYENLDEDYKTVCHKLGITYKILPKTKSKQRKEKKHYSTYFNDHIRDLVKEIYKRELDYFGYKFEATT